MVKALESFDQQVILLAGGHDKMTPLEDFMELVKEKTKAVIFMTGKRQIVSRRLQKGWCEADLSCFIHEGRSRERL